MPYAINKGTDQIAYADQPAYPRRLISPFVVSCLDSIKPVTVYSKPQ